MAIMEDKKYSIKEGRHRDKEKRIRWNRKGNEIEKKEWLNILLGKGKTINYILLWCPK